MKSPPKLSISYGDYSIKQRNAVEYLGCTSILILAKNQWLVEFLRALTLS